MQFLSLDWPGKSTLWAFFFEMASRRFESRQALERIHCCLLSGLKTSSRLVGRRVVVVDESDRLPKTLNSLFQPSQSRPRQVPVRGFYSCFQIRQMNETSFRIHWFLFHRFYHFNASLSFGQKAYLFYGRQLG